jgi:hypothetical protein
MTRITESFLQAQVDRLNRITGSPATPHINGAAQVGCFHLSYAYGRVSLHRMHNAGGACSAPLNCGYVTRRELSYLIAAFIAGYDAALTAQHKAAA